MDHVKMHKHSQKVEFATDRPFYLRPLASYRLLVNALSLHPLHSHPSDNPLHLGNTRHDPNHRNQNLHHQDPNISLTPLVHRPPFIPISARIHNLLICHMFGTPERQGQSDGKAIETPRKDKVEEDEKED